MPTFVQTLYSANAGTKPVANSRLTGEMWVNLADFQVGFIDATKTAQALLPVRYFQSTAVYNVGDCVVYGTALYQAKVAITPGVFNPTQWNAYFTSAGGTLTGPLTLAADPTTALGAATKQYADKMLPLAGGTLTGELTIVASTGTPELLLNSVNLYDTYIIGAKSGLDRWALDLGNSTNETGGNAGSDLTISRYSDAGALIDSPLKITRSTGIVSVANQPVSANDVATKNYVDGGGFAIGDTKITWNTTWPSNWLLCTGAVITIASQPALFAAIGNRFGGDGITTFGLPHAQDRVIVGAGGLYALGATGGEATHTLVTAEMPVHTHTITQTPHGHTDSGHSHTYTDPQHNHSYSQPTFGAGGTGSSDDFGTTAANTGNSSINITINQGNANISTANANITVNNAGSGSAHNNLQPYIAANVLIRAS